MGGLVSDSGRAAPKAHRDPRAEESEEREDDGTDERATAAGTSACEETGDDEETNRVERKEGADGAGN